MSPFLVTAPSSSDALLKSPFLVNNHNKLNMEQMKHLMNIFVKEDFDPIAPANKLTLMQENQSKQKYPQNMYYSTERPHYEDTSYRPVPDYQDFQKKTDLAEILANLILDHFENNNDSQNNKKLMKLLNLLDLDDDVRSTTAKPFTTSTTSTPFASLPQLPGPPYFHSNYFPPNSLVAPPQSLFQTHFNEDPQQPAYQQHKKFSQTFTKPHHQPSLLQDMVKNLMTNVETDSLRTSKPVKIWNSGGKQKPKFSPTTSNNVDFVVKTKRRRKPPRRNTDSFNRYVVTTPTKFTKSEHFSLPIDSFAQLEASARIDQDTSPTYESYQETLLKMMEKIGIILR